MSNRGMSYRRKGMNPAAAIVDPPAAAGRTRDGSTDTQRLKVEKLGVAAHTGTRVRFTYPSPATGALIAVDGLLERMWRPPGHGGATLLKVDRLHHWVPAGTLITVETRELR
jgi:hypothetical protein